MIKAISDRQLACLHALWNLRMRAAGVSDRGEATELRHQYIKEVTNARADSSTTLSFADARRVIQMLIADQSGSSARIPDSAAAHAAGTHGRRGYHDGRQQAMIGAPQTALLAVLTGRLGWDQRRLDAFVERQLGVGRQIRTMGDFNRVAWGMKSLIRQAERRAQLGCTKSPISQVEPAAPK